MTDPSKTPRFLKNQAEDIANALAELSSRSAQNHSKSQATIDQDRSPTADKTNSQRAALKAQLTSTWSEGASFEKWLEEATSRTGN